MAGSEGRSGWLLRSAPPAIDATPAFLQLYERARREPDWFPKELRACAFLLVPGIFTERYPLYFFQSKRRMKALGIDVRRVPMKTELPVAAAAAVIRDAVLRVAPRRTVLVAHSKGPLDAHAALLLFPEIVPHVRALVSLQAPFGGTPLATDEGPLLRRLISGTLRGLFRASPRSFFDLSYDAREQFLRAHGATCPVPAISLVTSAARAAWPLEHTRRYLQKEYGLESDGFVPAADAAIPGSRLVRLQGIDHAGLALRWLGRSSFEAAPLTQAILAMVAEQADDRAT
jgi:triacylglycerol lipase